MRQENWTERNRDRLLLVAGCLLAAFAAIWLGRSWQAPPENGKLIIPSDWRLPDAERLTPRLVDAKFDQYWNAGGRKLFHSQGPSEAPVLRLEMPKPMLATAPIPPPAVGALQSAPRPVIKPTPTATPTAAAAPAAPAGPAAAAGAPAAPGAK